ncbi:hypothetical protein Golob_019694 [Gossypium lobatum]|uniref:RNase H type-1 domain-containing protein n=1 Tax=Gossypium lobatum TaxID=34289 RepID=A0A7J8L834_9ROSI|nr:hypothetical protein [Gossypium lobatum]
MIASDGSWNLDISKLWISEEALNGSVSSYGLPLSIIYLRMLKGWVRLRIDGLIRFDEGFAAAGDFVGDQNDRWIIGFCRYLSNCIVLEVELWGILDGLNFILDRSFERVLIQTSSIETVNTIQEGSSGNSNSALVRRIHHILAQMKQWKIHHISRKESFIVDSLAKSIHSRRLSLRLVINPPMRI